MKIFNSSIVCESVKIKLEDSHGLVVPKKKNYIVLKVVDFDPKIEGIKKGDTIYVTLNSAFEVEIEDKSYQVVKLQNVILVL